MPITMTAGAQMSQYIELPKTAATFGQLQVRTEPAGARVSVDGMPRGTSPVTVADLTPGEHAVSLESDRGSVKQIVAVEAGITASLMVPLGAPRRRAGVGLDRGHRAGRRAGVREQAPHRHEPERSADGLGRHATTSRSSTRRSAIAPRARCRCRPAR